MKIKRAILQVADTGPLESLVVMLRSLGIECILPSLGLRETLRKIGCDTVLEIKSLVEGMGYSEPMDLPRTDHRSMLDSSTIYVDVKAHRNGPLVTKRWPNLKGRVLWYRINGGKPEHVIRRDESGKVVEDCGDEVNPGCPVLTPNQWYSKRCTCKADRTGGSAEAHDDQCPAGIGWTVKGYEDSYCCWPPFYRFDEFSVSRERKYGRSLGDNSRWDPAICLIHNVNGWGYRDLVEPIRDLGVKVFGRGSPDGLINHREVGVRLTKTLAMVHLKSSDSPGYAIYEAMAAGCPVVCTRRLIWRCHMEDLLIPGETCLVFDRETHDALSQEDVPACRAEVKGHLDALGDPRYNALIGEAGRAQLKSVMWSENRAEDVASLRTFLERNYQ